MSQHQNAAPCTEEWGFIPSCSCSEGDAEVFYIRSRYCAVFRERRGGDGRREIHLSSLMCSLVQTLACGEGGNIYENSPKDGRPVSFSLPPPLRSKRRDAFRHTNNTQVRLSVCLKYLKHTHTFTLCL